MIVLYLLANVACLATLPLKDPQHAPSDRVATAMLQAIFRGLGRATMALATMISTFGCINSLVLAGPRAYYAMARDDLFFKAAGYLNRARVPGWSLWVQAIWAAALVLPRTFDPGTGNYGNLYGSLIDYVVCAALIFYVLTLVGVFRLRGTQPDAEGSYRVFVYPLTPGLYVIGAGAVVAILFAYRPATTWPGLIIVLLGVPVYWLLKNSARPDAEN